ncbi:MAG: lytic transglycosylase domain-containing protein [Candidatus Nitrotoga sp.]|nr:lytic transglycosylase domain-containing protein [Candidatus Nitrotoga sp.]MDO9447418.1 lytic transglycosylase domain-containing protein [Candidatus Nitrotoga sp.]MDP3498362.1 lytic transglycosylase domain-containing protein [Candidatus Nitrotoga sp.]
MRPIQKCYSAYIKLHLLAAGLLFAHATHGSAQTYQPLSASVQISFNHFISDQAPPKLTFAAQREYDTWLNNTSRRLEKHIPDASDRVDFLRTVYYEATRAGLDPQLVLGLIQVESGFKKYAVSRVGARGYMQVMPFWLNLIGQREGNLFHLRTNLRYGCIILRHYLDMEKGNLYRALGRYNGSLGKPEYPNLVNAAWHKR